MNSESIGQKRGSCTVTITHLFPVSIPKADISLFKVSIPKEYYLNVIVRSLDSLKRKIEASCVPAGLFTSYRLKCYDSKLPGWINTTSQLSSSTLCLVKLGCSHAGEPEVVKSLIVQDDLTWYINVKTQRINSNRTILATLPQSVNSLSCLNEILAVVDTCTMCLGNDDENFRVLVTAKKHGFTDASG